MDDNKVLILLLIAAVLYINGAFSFNFGNITPWALLINTNFPGTTWPWGVVILGLLGLVILYFVAEGKKIL